MSDERASSSLHSQCSVGISSRFHPGPTNAQRPGGNACSTDRAPVVGFTPETSPRDANGVPLPNALGARNVVVTYTPVRPGGGALIKSGNAMVSVGDNYFTQTSCM